MTKSSTAYEYSLLASLIWLLKLEISPEVVAKLWMTMRSDRALWQVINDALSSANEMSIPPSTRISRTISRAQLFDGSYDGRKMDEGGGRAQNQ
jgi:hypothetical protein